MDKFWIFAAATIFVGIFTLRDIRRTKRHASRNAQGRCGFCEQPLGGSRNHQVSYRYSRSGPPEKVDICPTCFGRRRMKSKLAWLIVLAVAAVLIGLPILFPH